MQDVNWAIFISGRGSNMQSILDCIESIHIRLIISNNPKATGVLRARRMGIPVFIVEKKINWQELDFKLKKYKVDCIFLAGFMRIIPEEFVQKWVGKIINLHPSLLPKYPGLDSLQRSYSDQSDLGVTLHVVTPGLDEGPIIKQLNYYSFIKNISFEWIKIVHSFYEQFLARKVLLKWN